MNKQALKSVSIISLALSALAIKAAQAANLQDAFKRAGEVASSTYKTDRTLNLMLGDIITVVLSALGVVFIAFMIYAGYLWMTASGNEQKADKAIQILKESIIGLVVVIGAYAISYFVIQIFGAQLINP